MDDRDVEALLARYRPAHPDPEFESRLSFRLKAEATESSGRTWPWAVAAAALLAITIGLHAASREGAVEQPASVDAAATLSLELGGDDVGRRAAEFILAAQPPPPPQDQSLGVPGLDTR